MMSLSSGAVSLRSKLPCHYCIERWNSGSHGESMSLLGANSLFLCLPTNNNDRRLRRDGRSTRIVALAAAPVRWSLDDVERISRGLPSKAKMGSRAVPHRLNAEERKAFELAKKRGYVVQKESFRRYPLINSYRNYCDALGFPCIRIEQGTTGLTDQVVIDFTPLHLSEPDVSNLRAEITKAITLVTSMDSDQTAFGELPELDVESVPLEDGDDSLAFDTQDDSGLSELSMERVGELSFPGLLDGSSESLRFQAASRYLTKVISQTALDTWRSLSN